jgi:hypothetical protein
MFLHLILRPMQAAVARDNNRALFVSLLVVDQTGRDAVLDGGTFEIFNGEVGIGMIVEELDVPARRGGQGKENEPQMNTDERR